jgi:hypothetical protein
VWFEFVGAVLQQQAAGDVEAQVDVGAVLKQQAAGSVEAQVDVEAVLKQESAADVEAQEAVLAQQSTGDVQAVLKQQLQADVQAQEDPSITGTKVVQQEQKILKQQSTGDVEAQEDVDPAASQLVQQKRDKLEAKQESSGVLEVHEGEDIEAGALQIQAVAHVHPAVVLGEQQQRQPQEDVQSIRVHVA